MPLDMQKELKQRFGISFGLIIPAMVKEKPLAFLVLGEKLDNSVYSHDDINVFTILSRQAALAIENCIFFDEFKQVQLQLFQAEKLASIGGIADGPLLLSPAAAPGDGERVCRQRPADRPDLLLGL